MRSILVELNPRRRGMTNVPGLRPRADPLRSSLPPLPSSPVGKTATHELFERVDEAVEEREEEVDRFGPGLVTSPAREKGMKLGRGGGVERAGSDFDLVVDEVEQGERENRARLHRLGLLSFEGPHASSPDSPKARLECMAEIKVRGKEGD